MILSFGQFLISAEGKEELISSVPAGWQKQEDGILLPYECTRLHLAEATLPWRESYHDGWNILRSTGGQTATYCHGQKRFFSLLYTEPEKEITVLVNGQERKCVKLGIQFGILTALYRKCVGLHGVTMLCGNEIVVLSAPSGTGKTTLARLLEKYCDAIMINGDFAMLSVSNEGVIFEPTPFCGTSGRCLNHRVKINRIVFLSQSPINQGHDLFGREAMMYFMNNSFIPTWDPKMQLAIRTNIMKCISNLRVSLFRFAPTREAAEYFFDVIQGDSHND